MIAQLRGTIDQVNLDSLVIDCNGVGYLVHVPSSLAANCSVGEQKLVRGHIEKIDLLKHRIYVTPLPEEIVTG